MGKHAKADRCAKSAGIALLISGISTLERMINGDPFGLYVGVCAAAYGFAAMGEWMYYEIKDYIKNS